MFNSHQDIIDWVQNVGRSLCYIIIIKRSKNNKNGVVSKVIFQCDRGGAYKSTKISSRNTGTKKINCPFGLVGKYSSVNDCWTLSVICETHNHAPALHMEGHSYAMRLNENETQLLETLTTQNVKPRDILSTLKKHNTNNVSTPQTIYNARYKFWSSTKAGRTSMQVLISFLIQEDYIYDTRVNNKTNELEDLFFAHPRSLDL